MKNLSLASFVLIYILTLIAGCVDVNRNDTLSPSPQENQDYTNGSETDTTPPAPTNGKILVAYFSSTGTTERLAEYAEELLRADLYEIVPETPYTDADLNYSTDCRANREQKDPSARPRIIGNVSNMEKYEIVLLGYPIWHGQAPKIISTFLETYDFSNKTILPFCSSHSSGIGSSDSNLHPLAKNATWLDGKRFAPSATKEQIKTWLEEMDISTSPDNAPNVVEFDFAKKTVALNDGNEMPIIGLGTWTLSDEEAENCVYHALKCGMRLIDTARYYQCEVGVGKGIKKAISEGFVTRREIFVTSKIMPSDYSRASQGINDSLRDLGLDYVDLMLIHQPGYNDEAVYRAIEQAVYDGKVKSVGISNYYTKRALDKVLSYAKIPPAVIQNENHIYYQNTELQQYASSLGIVIESWYPFGGRGHTMENFNHPTVKELAEKYEKSSAQIILRWQLQAGYVAIPGSSNPDHIAENYDIFGFALTDAEMARISAINTGERYENW